MINILRWIFLLPLAILISTLASTLYAFLVSLLINDSNMFEIFGVYVQHFIQGISFIMLMYFIAPYSKLVSAFSGLLIFITIMVISEFYLKRLNSEPREIHKMYISIFGALLGTFNMYIMHVSDKARQ